MILDESDDGCNDMLTELGNPLDDMLTVMDVVQPPGPHSLTMDSGCGSILDECGFLVDEPLMSSTSIFDPPVN